MIKLSIYLKYEIITKYNMRQLTFVTLLTSPFWCETLDFPLAEGMALSKSGSSSLATK